MSDIAARIEAPSIPAINPVAAYLRVSTGKQAENDPSIPDQRRQFELYARKLAKNGVQIISIQETGDNPMGAMMRKIVTLFDEYRSKENAKHTLRAMCENARQGYWNGSRPPIGYRAVADHIVDTPISTYFPNMTVTLAVGHPPRTALHEGIAF